MSLLSYIESFLFPASIKTAYLEEILPENLVKLLPLSSLKKMKDTFAVFDYGSPQVKEIIWQIKYKGNRDVANKVGTILHERIWAYLMKKKLFKKYRPVLLIPMPISEKRKFERGWNQAELLTLKIISLDTKKRMQYVPYLLKKTKHTESQTTKDKIEREENLKGSMKVTNPKLVQNKCIVLIDDVLTTGSTFKEAKRALRLAGARRVICFALSH